MHDRDLAGELRQKSDSAMHHIVEVDGADQEPLDRAPLGRAQRLDPGEPVHEEPVAAVRGDAAGARVRLPDVTLLLQDRHVVTHGGRGDAEIVPLDQRLAADRLLRGDVVLDYRTQNGELAIVQCHRQPTFPPVRCPLADA